MHTRTETDSLGAIEVPVDRYYSAQTAIRKFAQKKLRG